MPNNQVVNRSDRQRVYKWQIFGGRPVTTDVRSDSCADELVRGRRTEMMLERLSFDGVLRFGNDVGSECCADKELLGRWSIRSDR